MKVFFTSDSDSISSFKRVLNESKYIYTETKLIY